MPYPRYGGPGMVKGLSLLILREMAGLSPNSVLIPGPILKEGSRFGDWVPPTATGVIGPGH